MRRTGFTLVEIIVATVIGAMVALTAVGTLRTITSGKNKIENVTAAAAELRFAADMLTTDLNNLYRDVDSRQVRLISVVETKDTGPTSRLLLRSAGRIKARPDQPEGDVYELEYFLAEQDDEAEPADKAQPADRMLLMRRVFPNPVGAEDPGGLVTAVAENVVSFNLMYFDGEQWTNEWPEGMTELPKLMDVSIASRALDNKKVLTSSFLINFARWPSNRDD